MLRLGVRFPPGAPRTIERRRKKSMVAINEEQRQKLLDRLDQIPTVQVLQNIYAVMLAEFMERVRDRIDNGNVQEVGDLIKATGEIDQLGYAIDWLRNDRVGAIVNKHQLEEIVDRAVEKVYEKMQGEEKSAVARKLKLDAATAATRTGKDAAPDSLALG